MLSLFFSCLQDFDIVQEHCSLFCTSVVAMAALCFLQEQATRGLRGSATAPTIFNIDKRTGLPTNLR